ncbi:Uncharacterized protein PCOAH_00032480 [Plasmodium coatneyi]|uniref:Uncharacterized protein n=1 Tax=Plasmodium coatneyi TaxID=208452 RepID=A0A1B1E1N1_9APIC|nr:Uncharacterized protein PCOAH_00032480 [Plasmodium coatneyi]ANQ08951.1 Uncharacterized protein PCOAH_00032480 [Plasmodium coatneyi]
MENVCKEQGKEDLITIDIVLTKYEQYVSGVIRNEELRKHIERFMFQYNCLDECEKKLIDVIKKCENFECKKFQAHYLFITNIVKEICHMELIPIIYNEILEERNAKSETSYLSREYYLEAENQKDEEENFKAICERVYKKYILVFIKLLYYSCNLPPDLLNNLISALSCMCILISKYDTFREPNEKFSELIYRIFWNYFSKSFHFPHESYFSLEENDLEEDDTSSSYYSELLNEDSCFPYYNIHNIFSDKRRKNSTNESASVPVKAPVAVSGSAEREGNNLQKRRRRRRRERKIPEKSKDAKGESCANEQAGENIKKTDDPFFAGPFLPEGDTPGGEKPQGDDTVSGVNSTEGCLPVESCANCEIENAGGDQASAVQLSETNAKVNKRLRARRGEKEKKKIKKDNGGVELANSSTLLNGGCEGSREHNVLHRRGEDNVKSNNKEFQTMQDVDKMIEGQRKDADAAPSISPSLHCAYGGDTSVYPIGHPIEKDLNHENVMFVNVLLNVYVSLFNTKSKKNFLFYRDNQVPYNEFLLDNVEIVIDQMRNMLNKIRHNLSESVIYFLKLEFLILLFLIKIAKRNAESGNAETSAEKLKGPNETVQGVGFNQQRIGRGGYMNSDSYTSGNNYANVHGYDNNFGSSFGGSQAQNSNPNEFQKGYQNNQESDFFPMWRQNESAKDSKMYVDPLSNSNVMNNVDTTSARSSIAGYDLGVNHELQESVMSGTGVGSDITNGSLYPNSHSATYADGSNSTPTVDNNINENSIDMGNFCEKLNGDYNCGMKGRNAEIDCLHASNKYSGVLNATNSGSPDKVIISRRYAAARGSQNGVPNGTNDCSVGGTNQGTIHFGKDAPKRGSPDKLIKGDTWSKVNRSYCNESGEGAYSTPNNSTYGAYCVQKNEKSITQGKAQQSGNNVENDLVRSHSLPGTLNSNESATGMNDIFLSNMKNNLSANMDGVVHPGQGYPYDGRSFPFSSIYREELDGGENVQHVEMVGDEEEEERRRRKREIEAEWGGEIIAGNEFQTEYLILNRDYLRNSVKKSTFENVTDMINNLFSNSFLEMLDVMLKCVEVNFKDENLTLINRIFWCMLKGMKYCSELNKYKIYTFILSKIDKLIKSKRYEENNSTLNNYSCYFLLNLIFNLFKRDSRRKRRNIWYFLFEVHVNKMKRKKSTMKVNSVKGDDQKASMHPPPHNTLDVNDYMKKNKSKNSELVTKMLITSLIKSNEKNKQLKTDQVKNNSVNTSENENDLMPLYDGKNFLMNNIINFLLECCISKGCIVRFMSLRIFYTMTILFIEFIKNRSLSYEERMLKNYIVKSIYQNFFLCIFNILKEPETNIFIYMKFRNLCLSLLFICSKILSPTFLNEFYDKVISYQLCCVDHFYRCRDSVCLTDRTGEHYDDSTLKSIYAMFLSNAKDLYLFAFLMLFRNSRNVINLKILKGILKISSEEVTTILGNLVSQRDGGVSERQDRHNRQERKDKGCSTNGSINDSVSGNVCGAVSGAVSDDVNALSVDGMADGTADQEGELQNGLPSEAQNGGDCPVEAKEQTGIRRRRESNKVELFRVKNINMDDFLTSDMQIKLKVKEQNEEEKKKTAYKNLYFINIFYIGELKKLNTYENNFIYYMLNCVFCFLNIYTNRFTFFFYFIKNEGYHRNGYFDHSLNSNSNSNSSNGNRNKDIGELGQMNEQKYVLEFIQEMLTLFRNFLHIVAVMEENLISVNVETLVKKKTRGSELTNIRSLKRLVILELQKFYFIFVKLLKALFLLNRINGSCITPFEFFFFKLIQSLDNELIGVNTKRHILKFLKYFSYKKKFKDTIISRINHFHSKVRSKKKKISDIFSKKEYKRQDLYSYSIRGHDISASNAPYGDDPKGDVNSIPGGGHNHPYSYDNAFKAEGEVDEEVEESHVDAPHRVKEPPSLLPPEGANQDGKKKSTRQRSGNSSRRSRSNAKKGQPGTNNSEEAIATAIEAVPKEEDPSAKNNDAGEVEKTANQQGNATGDNVTSAEAVPGTCAIEANDANSMTTVSKSKRRKCSSAKKDEAKIDIDPSCLIGIEHPKEEENKWDATKNCKIECEVKMEPQAEVENPVSNTTEQETRRSRYGRKSGVNTKEKNFSMLIEEEHEQKRKSRRMSRIKNSSGGNAKGRNVAKKEEEVKGVGATPGSEFLGDIPGGAPSRNQPQMGNNKTCDNNNNEKNPANVTTGGFFPEEVATQRRGTTDILTNAKNDSTVNKVNGEKQILEYTNEKNWSLNIVLNCSSNMIVEMDRLNYLRKCSALSSYKDYKVEKFFYDNLELFLVSIFIFEKNTKLNNTDFFLENFDKINEVIEFCKRNNIDRGIEKIVNHLFVYLSEIKNNKKYIHGLIRLITNTLSYIPVYKISESPFFFISFCCLFKHSKKKHVNKIIIQNFIIICMNYIDTLMKRTYNRRRCRMWFRSLLQHRRSEQTEQRTTQVGQNYKKVGSSPVKSPGRKVATGVKCTVDQAVAGSVALPGITPTDGATVVAGVADVSGLNGVTPVGDASIKEQMSKSSRSKKGSSRRGASGNPRSRRSTKKGEEAATQGVTLNEGGTNQVATATVDTQGMATEGANAKRTSNYYENNCRSGRRNSGNGRVSNTMSGVAPNDYFHPQEALLFQRNMREEKEITDKLLLNLINLYINFMCSFHFYYLTFYEDNYSILKNILILGIDKILRKKSNKKLTSFALSFIYILICLLLNVKIKEEFILTLSRDKTKGQKEMRRSEKREFGKKVEHISGKSRSNENKMSDLRGTGAAANDQREKEEEKKFIVKYLINLIDEKEQGNVNQISKKKFRKNINQVLCIKNDEHLENYSFFPKMCFYKNKMDKHIDKVFHVKKKEKLAITSSLNLKENLKKLNKICVNFSYKFIFNLLSEPLGFEKNSEWLISNAFKKDMKKDTNYAKYNFLDYIMYACFYIIFRKTKLIKMVKTNYQKVSLDTQNSKKNMGNIKMKSYLYNQKKYCTLQFYLAVEILNLIFNNLKYLPFSSIKLIIDIFLNRSFLTVWVDGKKEDIINKFQKLFHNFFCDIFYLQSDKIKELPYFVYQYQKSIFLVNLVVNSVVCRKKKPVDNFLLLDILKHCFPGSDLDNHNNSSDRKNEDKRSVERSHRMLRSKKVNMPI